MLGNLGNMASLLKQAPEIMKQAREMQGRMEEAQEKLAAIRVEASSGGGMVTAEASGQQKLTAIRIEQSLLGDGDHELLEDLVVSAVNQALDKAREAAASEMQHVTGAMATPGIQDMLASLGINPTP